jgi:UDP-N-acetylmuramate--alanine ligase
MTKIKPEIINFIINGQITKFMIDFTHLTIDGKPIKKVYAIGIKGAGLISLVELLVSRGIFISGSDTKEKFFTDAILKKFGVPYAENFSPANIPSDADLIIYSTAYNAENNIEYRTCQERNLKMFSYPEILAGFFNQKYGVAVCGTHGKTTTSALLGVVLQMAGSDPSAAIGGRVINWGSNALLGKGDFFVIEADEFQNKLKLYNPKAVILTSLDFDHPDCYKNFTAYKEAFKEFVARIPASGFLFVWGDSADTLEIAAAAKCQVIKYGFLEGNDFIITDYKFQDFKIIDSLNKDYGRFHMQLIGKHNLLNASGVVAFCAKFNIDLEKTREAIRSFRGTSRRFEYIGIRNGAILIDDYGHHPEEIKATLGAAREIYPDKNIIAVFHPHSYSRTEALLSEFAQSFDAVDKVIVLDIYGSARENAGKVSSKNLVDLINKYCSGKADYIPTISEAVACLQDHIGEKDVVIAIGAGNVFEVVEKLK